MLNRKLFVTHSTGEERNLRHIVDLTSLAQIITKNYMISRRPWDLFNFTEDLRRLVGKDYLSGISENDF